MVLDYRNMSLPSRVCSAFRRFVVFAAVGTGAWAWAPRAVEAQTASERQRAAEAFDDAVKAYERGDFGAAAAGFLRADAAVPNTETLTNALSAARRASEFLLVIEAADRLVSRADASEVAKAQARRARAEAASRLARVTFSCAPLPCTMTLDDRPTEPGERFVLPGVHRVHASATSRRSVDRTLQLDAGVTYSVELPLEPGSSAALPARAADQPDRAQARLRDTPAPAEAAHPAGLAPAWFYVGAGVTVALAGVTTWSGLDALQGKRDLGQAPTQHRIDDVKGRMRRTDLWLAGTVAAGALTAWAGFELVRWHDAGASDGSVAVIPSGPGASLRGQF